MPGLSGLPGSVPLLVGKVWTPGKGHVTIQPLSMVGTIATERAASRRSATSKVSGGPEHNGPPSSSTVQQDLMYYCQLVGL